MKRFDKLDYAQDSVGTCKMKMFPKITDTEEVNKYNGTVTIFK